MYGFWATLVVLGVLAIWAYGFNSKLSQETKRESQADLANQKIISTFFDYDNSRARYENIKPLATENGYKSLFPSGYELPSEDSQKFVSNISDLTQYKNKKSKKQIVFLSEFLNTTEFNEIKNTESMIVRTSLVLVDGKWMLDDLELVAQPSIE